MAKQDLTRVYSGADLSGATSGVVYLPIVRNSTLEKVSVRSDAAQSGSAVFEVRLNGVVIAGLAALTIPNGAKVGSISGLSVVLTDGDEITLNLVSGSVSAPVTFNLGTEDGLGSGGQSGGIYNADSPPLVAQPEDDEFLSPTFMLDPKWTRTEIGTITEQSINNRIQSTYFIRLAPGGGIKLTQPFAPGAADFSLTLAGYIVPTANYHNISISVKDSPSITPQTALQMYFLNNAGTKFQLNGLTGGSLNPELALAFVNDIDYSKSYIHIQRVSGTYEGYYSNNGVSWKKLFEGLSKSMTVSHFEIDFDTLGASVKTQGGIDWIRRDWLFL